MPSRAHTRPTTHAPPLVSRPLTLRLPLMCRYMPFQVRNAFMIMLRVVTFEAWTWPMYALFASFDSYFVVGYFGLAVVLGGFFVVNVTPARGCP